MKRRNLIATISLPLVILVVFIGLSLRAHTAGNDNEPSAPIHFELPMRIEPVLSGNFGEIRSNHFHSGLDFKTEKRTGIPVYATADGWISRIRIEAYGFGYALYLDHPGGYTSVYAHLNSYAPFIDSLSQALQYSIESFKLDTLLPPHQFPVKAGELIAYSGSSGSSSAPHLHFEIRDTRSEDVLDPLIWFGNRIPDTQAPRLRQVTLFVADHQGTIQGGLSQYSVATVQQDSVWVLKDTFPCAFGTLGLGIKAYDYMDNTTNIYGVWSIKLFKDDKLVYSRQMDRFAFSDTRFVNAMIDYNDWKKNNSIVMRSYLLPGNQWPNCSSVDRGVFKLSEGDVSTFRYKLSDRQGNSATLQFTLKGTTLPLPLVKETGRHMAFNRPNVWEDNGIRLEIPKGTLYEDIQFSAARSKSKNHTDIIRLYKSNTPLHTGVQFSLRIDNDTVSRKSQYYLAKKNDNGTWVNTGSGTYDNGWLATTIKEFGTYTVLTDVTPPKITLLDSKNAVKNRLFRIRVADDASGIVSWKGTIDEKWVLFSFNANSSELRYAFDDSRLTKNSSHFLVLTVTDACGNTRSFSHSFFY